MIVKILSGVPGCGKSTYAEECSVKYTDVYIVNTDSSFICGETGEYKFDPSKLAEYHARSLKSFIELINDDDTHSSSLVIVDNTNIHYWEWSTYLAAAVACKRVLDIELHIWVLNENELKKCIANNIHGVPEEVIRWMSKEQEYGKVDGVFLAIHSLDY